MKLGEFMPALLGATDWINKEVSRADLLGKPTLVYFWSSSCIQCRNFMPTMKILSDTNQEHLNIVMIHMPRSRFDADLETIKERAEGITVPILVDNNYKVSVAFSNPFTPAFYLFNKEGKLDFFQTGAMVFQVLLKRIARLLES